MPKEVITVLARSCFLFIITGREGIGSSSSGSNYSGDGSISSSSSSYRR